MSRPAHGSPFTDPEVRYVIARACYAAAAHAAGDVWSSSRLEQKLGFRPTSRAARKAGSLFSTSSGKKPLPTGCCKRWLRGHVPQDQTLRLIAQALPRAAESIRRWRDGPLAKSLVAEPRDAVVVGKQLRGPLCELLPAYLCWMTNRTHKAEHELLDALACSAAQDASLPLLFALIAINRQFGYPRSLASDFILGNLLKIQMRKAANRFPEMRFIGGDLLAYQARWAATQKAVAQAELVRGRDKYACVRLPSLDSAFNSPGLIRWNYLYRLNGDLRLLARSDSMAMLLHHHAILESLASEGLFFNTLRS